MSFSTDIKNEVTRLDSTKTEYISELSAIIRNAGAINNSIIISIENNSLARRIYKLFKDIYDLTPVITIRKRYGFLKNLIYIIELKNKKEEILEDLSIYNYKGEYINIPKEYILGDEDAIRAYLRGIFLTTGSINDPKTSRYHLEFLVTDKSYAEFIMNLLNNFNLNSKIIRREKHYMIYIKEAEKISDFLRIIKAYNGVLYYEDIRIYRDHKNMTNRLNNCEQANVDKIFITSNNLIKDINYLKELCVVETLDDKMQEVIEYRLKYPEASLIELSSIITLETGHKITKSGLNHRFRKLREIANNIRNNKD